MYKVNLKLLKSLKKQDVFPKIIRKKLYNLNMRKKSKLLEEIRAFERNKTVPKNSGCSDVPKGLNVRTDVIEGDVLPKPIQSLACELPAQVFIDEGRREDITPGTLRINGQT